MKGRNRISASNKECGVEPTLTLHRSRMNG